MFDFDYWEEKCLSLYCDCLKAGYSKKESFKCVEIMMHALDKHYGQYVIGWFLFDFYNDLD